MRVRVTRPSIKNCANLKRTFISTFIWKITFCSRVQWKWRPRSSDADRDHADITRRLGIPGYYLTTSRNDSQRSVRNHEGTGGSVVSFADGLCHLRPHLHGVSGDVPGCVESAPNQRTRERCVYLSCLAAGPRSCTSVRMGRKFYLGNRLLFHSEDARRSEIFIRNGMDELGDVDDGRGIAVGRKCVLVGVEIPSAVLCFSGIRGISHFLPRSFPASAGSFR